MKRYRERSEIIEEILQSAVGCWISKQRAYEASKTSGQRFKTYYQASLDVGFLKQRENGANKLPRYLCRTTESGLDALKTLKEKSIVMQKIKERLK
jgi:predicted transcriptional regulator